MFTGRMRIRGPGIFAPSASETPSSGCTVSTSWLGCTPTDPDAWKVVAQAEYLRAVQQLDPGLSRAAAARQLGEDRHQLDQAQQRAGTDLSDTAQRDLAVAAAASTRSVIPGLADASTSRPACYHRAEASFRFCLSTAFNISCTED